MKKMLIGMICMMMLPVCWAQSTDELVNNYIQYYNKGDLDTKIEIIETAVKRENVNFGPLHHVNIDFILNDPDVLKQNPSMGRILIASLEEIEEWKYKEARISVLKLFELGSSSRIRITALQTLQAIGKGDKVIVEELNEWLDNQNSLFLSLLKPEFNIVDVAIRTLGIFGDETSFPFLFTAMFIDYNDQLSQTAYDALFQIEGDMKDHLLRIIEKGKLINKYEVLKFTIREDKLPKESKEILIKQSLRMAYIVESPVVNEVEVLMNIRYMAIREITPYKAGDVTSVVIKHFELMKFEYDKGRETNSHVIEALNCLGSMGTHEAAVTCAKYLEYINLFTEKKKVFDEQIVLTLINNLEILNDKIAIDPLQYTVFLDYNDKIKKAAQEVADKLMGL